MFTTIQPHERETHAALIEAAYRLRKRVFHDRLGWAVRVRGEEERDRYDELGPTTLVWCDPERRILYGAVRLMPLDGPTLLRDVFAATQQGDPVPRRPDVWEGTRMCLDEEAVARDVPNLDPRRGFGLLLLALCEAGVALGLRRLVSNFEAPMARVYRRAGLDFHLHGRADGFGARPVHCASFEVSAQVLATMRRRLEVPAPIFSRSAAFAPIGSTPCRRRAAPASELAA